MVQQIKFLRLEMLTYICMIRRSEKTEKMLEAEIKVADLAAEVQLSSKVLNKDELRIMEPGVIEDVIGTYELSSCYNVTIDCRAADMIATVRTNKIFNGKIYAKDNPNSCVTDVDNGIEFSIKMEDSINLDVRNALVTKVMDVGHLDPPTERRCRYSELLLLIISCSGSRNIRQAQMKCTVGEIFV